MDNQGPIHRSDFHSHPHIVTQRAHPKKEKSKL